MNRNTKEEQKRIEQKMVNVAYGTTPGAAIGVVIDVGAVAGGVGALFAVTTATRM